MMFLFMVIVTLLYLHGSLSDVFMNGFYVVSAFMQAWMLLSLAWLTGKFVYDCVTAWILMLRDC